jgi:hypothetical protein
MTRLVRGAAFWGCATTAFFWAVLGVKSFWWEDQIRLTSGNHQWSLFSDSAGADMDWRRFGPRPWYEFLVGVYEFDWFQRRHEGDLFFSPAVPGQRRFWFEGESNGSARRWRVRFPHWFAAALLGLWPAIRLVRCFVRGRVPATSLSPVRVRPAGERGSLS